MKIDKINLDGKKDSIEVLDKIFSAKINHKLVNSVLYKINANYKGRHAKTKQQNEITGSTGQRQDPGKVFKGKKMAGHMGDKLRTMQNIEIIKTDIENELLYLKGSIPGSKNSEILVKKSIKNINKLSIDEKIKAAEQAKKTPDKKKK